MDVHWIEFVHTSNNNQVFIDIVDFLFPFYSRNQDLYDYPCWTYIWFEKPWKWTAHVYAVKKNDKGE